MSLTPIKIVTHRTLGSASNSGKRLMPLSPAPSDDWNRPEPIPALNTETGVPSGNVGSLADSRSGQSPFGADEQAPSVMESPSVTRVAAGVAGRTRTSATKRMVWVVVAPDIVGSDV